MSQRQSECVEMEWVLRSPEPLQYFGVQDDARLVALPYQRDIDHGFDGRILFAEFLETSYGVLTRAGLHCAPLAHAAFGTIDRGGTTRLSFGPFLSKQDVKYATDALAEIANLHAAHRDLRSVQILTAGRD